MRAPQRILTRSYSVPPLDSAQARSLSARIGAQPGVREVQLAAGARTAYLKVDAAGYNEELVLRLIADAT